MLALILLSNFPLAFSECVECKEVSCASHIKNCFLFLDEHVPYQVNGTGPLAGLYELTNSEEPRCK